MTKPDYAQLSLDAHRKSMGKYAITSKMPLETKDDLSIAYTPGVAAPCLAIKDDPSLAYEMTMKGNSVAVVSDGSAVLGLGNIGPMAGLPVMEGKAVLYKKYADIDAVPIVLASQDVEKVIEAVKMIAPTFGGIHLEDIAAPQCFDIEQRLIEELNIPVMHDDQHATAIVILAGLLNALKIVSKSLENIKIVINGAGAAGLATANLLADAGAKNIVVLDSQGIISSERRDLSPTKAALVRRLGLLHSGNLSDAAQGADVLIGVSKAKLFTKSMVQGMAPQAIIFALANPEPEILPDEALAAGAAVVATGRSDYPNQVNNVLVYPGLFRGLLKSRQRLTSGMKLAAARALADSVKTPTAESILPSILEFNPATDIANAVCNYDASSLPTSPLT